MQVIDILGKLIMGEKNSVRLAFSKDRKKLALAGEEICYTQSYYQHLTISCVRLYK
jgi:hypothetical protein